MTPDRYRTLASGQDFLTVVEQIVGAESARTGNRWLALSKLNSLFVELYGISASEMARQESLSSNFYNLLSTSGRFSIYRTPDPDQLYVALLIPNQLTPTHKRKPRLKQRHIPENRRKNKPESIPEINSLDELETALVEIIQSLTIKSDSEYVPLTTIGHTFFQLYQQPIRTIQGKLAPDMTLIELLQTVPELWIRKTDGFWQVSLLVRPCGQSSRLLDAVGPIPTKR